MNKTVESKIEIMVTMIFEKFIKMILMEILGVVSFVGAVMRGYFFREEKKHDVYEIEFYSWVNEELLREEKRRILLERKRIEREKMIQKLRWEEFNKEKRERERKKMEIERNRKHKEWVKRELMRIKEERKRIMREKKEVKRMRKALRKERRRELIERMEDENGLDEDEIVYM